MAVMNYIRFFDNQYITSANSTASSAHASYPFTNAFDPIRSRLYQPNGTNIWSIEWDLGVSSPISFFGAIGRIQAPFTVSEVATVTLKANSIPSSWVSPAFSGTITPSEKGMFLQIDNSAGGYRYWRLDVDDSANATQNEIGYMYLGDHVSVSRAINRGFSKKYIDKSTVMSSVDGTKYFDEKQAYVEMSGLTLAHIADAERVLLDEFIYEFGVHKAFFVSLDPTLAFSTNNDEYTKFVTFSSIPNFVNTFNDVFSMGFSVEESI